MCLPVQVDISEMFLELGCKSAFLEPSVFKPELRLLTTLRWHEELILTWQVSPVCSVSLTDADPLSRVALCTVVCNVVLTITHFHNSLVLP